MIRIIFYIALAIGAYWVYNKVVGKQNGDKNGDNGGNQNGDNTGGENGDNGGNQNGDNTGGENGDNGGGENGDYDRMPIEETTFSSEQKDQLRQLSSNLENMQNKLSAHELGVNDATIQANGLSVNNN